MGSPLVSVIIPTYNRADTIRVAIDSVRAQTYKNIQLIVVDDGSRDHTRELLANSPDIEYVYQDNQGQAAARNTGLAMAKGELIASLDSDDYWSSVFLEKCVDAILRHNLDFVFANWYQMSNGEGKQWEDFFLNYPFIKPFLKNKRGGFFLLNAADLRALYLRACPSPSSAVVMKRSSIPNGWNQNLNIGDDWGLYLDMILAKPCSAAFTMEKLWNKGVDGQNVYEGRDRVDLVRLLLIEDTKEILNNYTGKLNKKEHKMLERQYVAGVMELGKHVLVREGQLAKALALFRRGLSLDVAHGLLTVLKLVGNAFGQRIRIIKRKIRGTKQSSAITARH